MNTPITQQAIKDCFQCGPTNAYKVYARDCEKLEIKLNASIRALFEANKTISEIRAWLSMAKDADDSVSRLGMVLEAHNLAKSHKPVTID